ncbi:MAG: TetR/AcrR family transcriptional regulator [Actinomycetota bacterium]
MTSSRPDTAGALRSATAALVAERGPTGFSLREVARRAGVSHAAPAHHFGDSRGLLTAVATEGFQTLSANFDTALVGIEAPVARLTAMGRAYVRTAQENPGHFGVMCNDELVDNDDPEFAAVASAAYLRLVDAIAAIRDAHNPDLDVDAAATLTFSAIHGLAILTPSLGDLADKTDTATAPADDLVERFTEFFMHGFAPASERAVAPGSTH